MTIDDTTTASDVPRWPLIDEAEYALKMLELALGSLAAPSIRDRRSTKSAVAVLEMAKTRLSAGVDAHTAAAERELSEIILDALGAPRVTVAEMIGARRMLTLLLNALPGGAA
jgi:hypothetical protein